MKLERQDFRDLKTVAARAVGAYHRSAPAAWGALWEWVMANGHGENVRRVIGYGMDNPACTPPEKLRYVAAVEMMEQVDVPADAPVEALTIAGGTYAVHRMIGPYAGMPDTFQDLFAQAGDMGLEMDSERPCLEIYLNSPAEVREDELATDLCLPVKAD